MSITLQGRVTGTNLTATVAEPFTFPGGEAHLKNVENIDLSKYDYFVADLRGHNPQDLFHLALFDKSLERLAEEQEEMTRPLYVILPYLPAARADRGIAFGAAVYAEFLSYNLIAEAIIGLDPHSQVMPQLLKDDMTTYVEFPFERIIKKEIGIDAGYTGVIAPDKGAHDRAARAAAVLHVPVYTAGKKRDETTGKLSEFHMVDELPQEGKFLVVDDICDGGGTFIGLSEAIAKTNPDIDIDLWVTHGIFSKGLSELSQHFDVIHTTDSYFKSNLEEDSLKLFSLSTSPSDGYLKVSDHVKVHAVASYLYAEVHNIHIAER